MLSTIVIVLLVLWLLCLLSSSTMCGLLPLILLLVRVIQPPTPLRR